jgi:hypothetical protein
MERGARFVEHTFAEMHGVLARVCERFVDLPFAEFFRGNSAGAQLVDCDIQEFDASALFGREGRERGQAFALGEQIDEHLAVGGFLHCYWHLFSSFRFWIFYCLFSESVLSSR